MGASGKLKFKPPYPNNQQNVYDISTEINTYKQQSNHTYFLHFFLSIIDLFLLNTKSSWVFFSIWYLVIMIISDKYYCPCVRSEGI